MRTGLCRVALVVPSHWSRSGGGAEYQVEFIARELLKLEGIEVHWLSRRVEEGWKSTDYHLHQIGANRGFLTKAFFFDAIALLIKLHTVKPHALYQRVGSAYTGICAIYSIITGCPFIWHVASDWDVENTPRIRWFKPSTWLRAIDAMFFRVGRRRADVIIAQTALQQRALQKVLGKSDVLVIRNGMEICKDEPIPVARKRVMWIGNLKPVKNVERFLELSRAFTDRLDLTFDIVGAPYQEEGQRRAFMDSLSRYPNVRYHGYLSFHNVGALLREAAVLVNTSSTEGFPNTFIQAWMRRVPVLSLHVDPDGFLAHGGCGHCCNGDFMELQRSLRALLSDAEWACSLGSHGRAVAERDFSSQNTELVSAQISAAARLFLARDSSS